MLSIEDQQEERDVSRNWKRLILIGLAVPNILSGCWAVFSPANWYENFPGWSPRVVSALPPFNEHLVFDTGSGLLATGLLVLIAGLCLRRDITVIATVGYLAFSLPHAVFHLQHPGEGLSTAQDAWNVAVLWLVVVLAGTVLIAEVRRKEPS